MNENLTSAAILVGVLVVLAVARAVVPALIGRWIGGTVARAIGDQALARQPDTIHLRDAGHGAWRDASAARAHAEPIMRQGFVSAGAYHVQEMPGVVVHLLASTEEGFYAAVYEHPQAGHWMDLVSRFTDGTSVTFTTSKVTGLAQRPGHPTFHSPELSPEALLERARAERPKRATRPATVEAAPLDFEQAYAESMAYRKRAGISAAEVVEVAKRAA